MIPFTKVLKTACVCGFYTFEKHFSSFSPWIGMLARDIIVERDSLFQWEQEDPRVSDFSVFLYPPYKFRGYSMWFMPHRFGCD